MFVTITLIPAAVQASGEQNNLPSWRVFEPAKVLLFPWFLSRARRFYILHSHIQHAGEMLRQRLERMQFGLIWSHCMRTYKNIYTHAASPAVRSNNNCCYLLRLAGQRREQNSNWLTETCFDRLLIARCRFTTRPAAARFIFALSARVRRICVCSAGGCLIIQTAEDVQ